MPERTNNKRKLIYKGNKKNIFISFWNWGWNIYYNNPEFWNYVIVGLFTTIVNIVSKLILLKYINRSSNVEVQLVVFISWFISVLFAYFPNRIFVFKTKTKNYFKEFLKFILGRLSTFILDFIITYIFKNIFGLVGIFYLIYYIIDQILIMIGNYFISKIFVFKGK